MQPTNAGSIQHGPHSYLTKVSLSTTLRHWQSGARGQHWQFAWCCSRQEWLKWPKYRNRDSLALQIRRVCGNLFWWSELLVSAVAGLEDRPRWSSPDLELSPKKYFRGEYSWVVRVQFVYREYRQIDVVRRRVSTVVDIPGWAVHTSNASMCSQIRVHFFFRSQVVGKGRMKSR